MKKRKKKKLVDNEFKIPYQAMKKIRRGKTVYHKNIALLDRSIHEMEKMERKVMDEVMDSLLKEEPFNKLVNRIVEKISEGLGADSYEIVYSVGDEIDLKIPGADELDVSRFLKEGKIFTGEDLGISDNITVIPVELDEDTILAILLRWKDTFPPREIFEFLKEKLERMLKESARLREMFEERYKDHLTGLLNRKAFDRDIRNLKDEYSLIFIDVDDFKSVNDTYGHNVGDEILVRIAKVLRDSTRSTDRIYRYGGDEFIVLLPGTDSYVAKSIAKRIEDNVRGKITLDGKPVTVSCGVASSEESVEDILKEADRRMYKVKDEKKNLK